MKTLIEKYSSEMGLNEETVLHILRNRPPEQLLCSCGSFRKTYMANGKFLSLYRCCGRRECEPNYGKKRPKHSAIMKEKAKEKDTAFSKTLMKKNQFFNKEVNTESFYEKQMINAGFAYDKDNIMEGYGKFRSAINKSESYRKKRIKTIYEKADTFWKNIIKEVLGFDPTNTKFFDVDKVFLLVHGIQSQINMEKNIRTGSNSFYKREVVGGLKYHKRGVTCVITRSSTEANYIRMFEKEKVCWDYEHILIRSEFGLYKPDFEIFFDNMRNCGL